MLLATSLPLPGIPSGRLVLARFLLRPHLLTRLDPLPVGRDPAPCRAGVCTSCERRTRHASPLHVPATVHDKVFKKSSLGDKIFEKSSDATVPNILKIGIRNPLGFGTV